MPCIEDELHFLLTCEINIDEQTSMYFIFKYGSSYRVSQLSDMFDVAQNCQAPIHSVIGCHLDRCVQWSLLLGKLTRD